MTTPSVSVAARDPRVDRALIAVMGIVASAFLAWAFVVHSNGQKLVAGQSEILVRITQLEGEVQRVDARLTWFVQQLNEHRNLDWHDSAGAAIYRSEGELKRIRDRIGELYERVDEHVDGASTRHIAP